MIVPLIFRIRQKVEAASFIVGSRGSYYLQIGCNPGQSYPFSASLKIPVSESHFQTFEIGQEVVVAVHLPVDEEYRPETPPSQIGWVPITGSPNPGFYFFAEDEIAYIFARVYQVDGEWYGCESADDAEGQPLVATTADEAKLAVLVNMKRQYEVVLGMVQDQIGLLTQSPVEPPPQKEPRTVWAHLKEDPE